MKPLFGQDSAVPLEKRIVFIGDSITDEGTYIAYMDAYFLQHMPRHRLTLINLGVSSETASGLSETAHEFPRPCVHERLERVLVESKPDWAVLCYGMNDGIYAPYSEERFSAYREGMLKAIRIVQEAGILAIVMTPPPFDRESMQGTHFLPLGETDYSYITPYGDYSEVMRKYADWVFTLTNTADSLVNIHDPLLASIARERSMNPAYLSGDGIHPNGIGHWIMAQTLLRSLFNITLDRTPEYVLHSEQSAFYTLVWERHRLLSAAWKEHVGHTNPNKAEAAPLEQALEHAEQLADEIRKLAAQNGIREATTVSVWKGYKRIDFYVNGREGFIIQPKNSAEGNPWLWRAEFFDAFPTADMALLEQGWAIAYYRQSDMYGCSSAIERMHLFQQYVISTYRLAAQAVLFGFSRGGMYAFNYAAAYPQSVAVLYLDAPVLDIRSWPGGKGIGIGAAREWEECLAVHGITEENSSDAKCSPLDRISAVAVAGIPIIIVAGDADVSVPLSENAAILAQRYARMGGTVELIVKPGVGHHPHSLEDPTPIVSFILEQTGYS